MPPLLLGLGMLAAMEHALEICSRRGHPVDLVTIPKDDPAVFDLLCRADTIGTFQVESRAQMATLPIMRPQTFYDVAICRQRPGTAKGHCFISLEDETGIANLFVKKETFNLLRRVIVTEPFLLANGILQRSEGDQPTVYVLHVEPLSHTEPTHVARSHDFH